MKKGILRIFAAVALMFSLSFGLSACGYGEPVSIAVVEESYQTTFNQGEVPSFMDMKVTVTYENGQTKEIASPLFTVGALNTTVIGEKTITISYQGLTTTITVDVIVDIAEDAIVMGFEAPTFIATYTGNISEQTNKETEFKVRDAGYFVGDDNVFVVMPKVTLLTEDNQSFITTAYESNITITKLVGEEFASMTQAEVEEMVAIDSIKYEFNFTESAIGQSFKILITPKMGDNVDESIADEKIELVVNVVDGWNVYTAADLSRLDNYAAAWTDYKAANNVGSEAINGLILQADINLTNADLPAAYFHKVGDPDVSETDLDYAYISANNGSMRDVVEIYERRVANNGTFTFNGNYFTIDASAISLITRNNGAKPTEGSYVIPNTALFDYSVVTGATVTNATLKNVNFIGNATRSAGEENTDRIGGLIMLDSWYSKTIAVDNIIAKSWITTFRITYSPESCIFSNCRVYDNYSTSVYFWDNGLNTTMTNCEFKRSGGPLFMLTDASLSDSGANYSALTIDADCVLENFVSGQEPWFTINSANSIVSGIVALDALIRGYSAGFGMPKTFVNENGLINFISVIVPADALTDSGTVYGTMDIGTHSLDMSDPTVQGYIGSPYGQGGSPIFSTNGVTCCYDGASSLVKLTGTGPAALDAGDAGLFMGDYINLFVKAGAYLGVTLGYLDYVPQT